MDVRFCERRDHSREAPHARAKDLDQKSARSRERAWPRVFFLDRRLTWMSDTHKAHFPKIWRCLCVGGRSIPRLSMDRMWPRDLTLRATLKQIKPRRRMKSHEGTTPFLTRFDVCAQQLGGS